MITLTEKMKLYEAAYEQTLPRKLPVIVRIDGIAFSTLTKSLCKPWDARIDHAFSVSIRKMFEIVQGLQFAYHQSDEVSFLLTNNQTPRTEPWLGNRVNKLNTHMAGIFSSLFTRNYAGPGIPAFDARSFVLPNAEETIKYFTWRQLNAINNSRIAFLRQYYSHEYLLNKSAQQLEDIAASKHFTEWARVYTGHKIGEAYTTSNNKSFVRFWEPTTHQLLIQLVG